MPTHHSAPHAKRHCKNFLGIFFFHSLIHSLHFCRGFQFWRQGYWADHLRGKPYHISALYVVDLQVFRQQAIGDRLRGVYDSLAKDPNSLANLDQVPLTRPSFILWSVSRICQIMPSMWSLSIPYLRNGSGVRHGALRSQRRRFSSPSSCDIHSLFQAKTIDLCNNPLHKEPKLDMARRWAPLVPSAFDPCLFPALQSYQRNSFQRVLGGARWGNQGSDREGQHQQPPWLSNQQS